MCSISEQELRWKCRRGMLELDILLNRYVERCYADMAEQDCQTFIRLLDYPDQLLHDLLISDIPTSDPDITTQISQIKHHATSD